MTLESFYLENYPIVYGYLLSLCRRPELAEELAAETFLRALEHLDHYDGRCKPSTWLCQIGKNLYFSERSRQRRFVPLEDAPPELSPSAEDAAAERETLAALLRRAEALPEAHRQVFFMRLEGMRFREIGSALGKSETWARVTYFRVKSKLMEDREANEE